MENRYLVTTHTDENWFWKFLRRIKLNKRGNFELVTSYGELVKNDMLLLGEEVLVLKKLE